MAASQPPTTDKPTETGPSAANGAQNGEKKLEHLGALEEDDEFEVSLYLRSPAISAFRKVYGSLDDEEAISCQMESMPCNMQAVAERILPLWVIPNDLSHYSP